MNPPPDSELVFFNRIKHNVRIMFDIGTNDDSLYLDFQGVVHYFDPYAEYMEKLKKKPCRNTEAHFNSVGLGEKNDILKFFPKTYSLMRRDMSGNLEVTVPIIRGDYYMEKMSLNHIDFMKVDTEGWELSVFKGFGSKLNQVKIIQFEYGIAVWELGYTLRDMISYLIPFGFVGFAWMFFETNFLVPITNFRDTWRYSNIVAYNKQYFSSPPVIQ